MGRRRRRRRLFARQLRDEWVICASEFVTKLTSMLSSLPSIEGTPDQKTILVAVTFEREPA
jgi:hypothetical protein